MNIVYFSKPSFGDCDLPLIKAMMALGHKVTVIYSMNKYSMHTTIFDINKLYNSNGLFHISVYPELNYFKNYLQTDNFYVLNDTEGRFRIKSILYSIKLMRFIANQKPDVINYVESPSPIHALLLWLFRKKLIITIHDGKPHTGEEDKRDYIVRRIISTYVRKYILLNKAEVKVFSENYNINPAKCFTSHLGYYEMLQNIGHKDIEQGSYFLFFGRISPYKGVEYLLKAMKIVHEKFPYVKLIIAGKPNYDIQWETYRNLEYVEIRDRYIKLDELSDLIRGALFTVCPYTDATQSGVVHSSFALNTPVIATRVGGLPEMIEDGITGQIIDPKNVNAISNAICKYLDDPLLLKQHSDNIAENARIGKASWRKIAEEYIKIYQA